MVKIFNRQVSGLPTLSWARGRPTCIVAHDVANMNSTIDGEISYMSNNWDNAFYHVLVGTKGAYVLHDPSKGGAWGAGASMHNYAIHIELKNYKTKAEFDKSYKNYVATVQYYAKKYDIPLKLNTGSNKRGIYTHNYVSKTFGGTNHTDPDAYFQRYGKTISQFRKDLNNTKKKGELSVKEKEELKQLRKQVKSIKKQLNKKADKPYTSSTPGDAHKDNVDWAKKHGVMDDSNPYDATQRQQTASVIKGYDDYRFPEGGEVDSSHEDAYKWMKDSGISNADNPHMPITYEQFSSLLRRYDEIRFPKGGDADVTHEDAVKWAVDNGLTDVDNPHTPIKYEQFLTILSRYDDLPSDKDDEKEDEDKDDKKEDKKEKD